jgi:hypothetical protein
LNIGLSISYTRNSNQHFLLNIIAPRLSSKHTRCTIIAKNTYFLELSSCFEVVEKMDRNNNEEVDKKVATPVHTDILIK